MSGLVPTEESSGDRRRLGHISKQGNVLLRFLLVEAAQVTVRSQRRSRHTFFHLAMRRGRRDCQSSHGPETRCASVLDVARGCDYGQWQKLGSHAGKPGNRHGAVDKQHNDWASRSPSAGEFEEVIMIAFGDRRDGWVGLSFLTLTIKNEPRLETQNSLRAKWRSSSSACCSALKTT